MARGITESDVHTAADEIVGAGERPTVERIRAHLGTGSPNTVTRWLETWWKNLGGRLQLRRVQLAIPDAPEAVAALAGELWRLALEHARSIEREDLTAERDVLHRNQEALRKDRETFSAEASAMLNRAEAAIQAERLASTQAAELQRLVNQLEGQSEEMSRQRDDALTRVSEANASRQAADLRLQELQEDSRSERESLAQHVRAIEDRAHSEIDRARQESKELQGRVIAIAKERAAIEKSLLIAVEQAKATATEASRQASIERARAEALEKQLAKLSDLPAALEEAMRRGSGDPPKEWKIGAKKTVRGSRSRAKVSTEKP